MVHVARAGWQLERPYGTMDVIIILFKSEMHAEQGANYGWIGPTAAEVRALTGDATA